MAKSRDLALAERFADGGLKMIRDYISDMRRQGKIKGKLSVILKDGKRQLRFPYKES